VSGRVLDGTTNQPMPNVLVKLVLPAPAAPVTPTQPLTPTGVLTPTEQLTPTAPATDTQALGKVIAAPLEASLVLTSPTATTLKPTLTPLGPTRTPAPTNTPAPTSTPMPPTATPTPKPIPPKGDGFLAVYTDEGGNYFFKDVPEGATLTFKMPGYKLTKSNVDAAQKDVALEQFKAEAIYITANWAASPDLLEETLDWVKESRINAIVVNVQNDASEWVFDTQNEDVLAANNHDKFMTDMADFVKDLQSRDLYVIARVVVFQQKTMAEQRPEWAVLSSESGGPWKGGYAGHQKWLDASNPAAQDHMIAMTKEVLQLGFDEIQYDYVRFPSDPAPSEDGDMIFSAGAITDTGKVQALKGFLKKAYEVIQPTDAFLSIDLFGYTLWPDRDGRPILGVIGQVIPELIEYTDYICPMIYPSHFSPGEQGCDVPARCAYELVHKSGEYAQELFAGHRAKYRPWLEDFDWPGADYTSPGSKLVPDQIRAAAETGAWGWMMWDPAVNYEPRSAFEK
ncbi:MAG: putative glycoside hydrolase, partial [Chloroflexia bacterium]